MSVRIFICHASEDRPVAERLCALLEAAGLVCWIAPRDIASGHSYGAAIVEAIRTARHFILLLSERATHSRHIENEVERAFSQRLTIHPLRLDTTALSPELEYFLSRPQYFDLFGAPIEQRMEMFVRGFLKSAAAPVRSEVHQAPAQAPSRPPLGRTPRGDHRLRRGGDGRAPTRKQAGDAPPTGESTPIVPENIRIVASLTGATGSVVCVACSPDGALIAGGSIGGFLSNSPTLHLWRARDGKLLRTWREQTALVHAVAFSPDGSILASGDQFGVNLWNAATGANLRHLGAGSVHGLAFSPDGRLLASAAQVDFEEKMAGLDVWRVGSGRRLHRLPGHTRSVLSAAFSPSGAMLASGGEDKTVRLWHLQDGRLGQTLSDAGGEVWSLTFLNDGEALLLAGGDQGLRMWDPRMRAPQAFVDATTTATAALSPCATMVAATSSDEKIRFFRLSDRELVRTIDGPSRVFGKNVCYGVAFSPDGRMLASAWDDRQVRLLALT